MQSPLRIVFMGTSSFAVPSLKALQHDKRFTVTLVITQPDRPAGRHADLQASPIKETALSSNLPILQPESIKDPSIIERLKQEQADVFVVASYGQIIPQTVLDIPKLGCINVHGSLLPKYRGASPIHAAIKNGDKMTGVTIMLMDAKLDHGPILKTAESPIELSDTWESLHAKLADLGAKILTETIIDLAEKRLEPQTQDHTQATKTGILSREDGKIDWSQSAEQIECHIRAYHPWPGTFTLTSNGRLKILKARIGSSNNNSDIGTLLEEQSQPKVVCGHNSSLILEQVQPEGKPVMSGKDFLNGLRSRNQLSSFKFM